jgi:uncharacterized protein
MVSFRAMTRILVCVKLIALWMACCLLASAVLAGDLYTGETTLDEGESITTEKLLLALDQVMVRLTGMTDRSPVAVMGLGAADVRTLLQTQQRIRVDRLAADGSLQPELRLRVEFYPAAVDRLLERHQIRRLGRERPSILLWVAMDDEDGIRLASDPVLEQWIDEQARRFGLDVIRPLGDAMDMAELDVADIRGGFLDAAEAGAQRYRAGVVAMLDLRAGDDYWSGRWFWRLEGRDSGLSLTADEFGPLIEQGLKGLLKALSERYGMVAGPADRPSQRVVVEGVVDPIQYAEIVRYLDNLSIVQGVQVIGAHDRRVEFELALTGGGLDDLIAMSRILVLDQRTSDGTLYLRLQR